MNKLNVTVSIADIPESERERRWAALSRLLIPLNEVGPDVGAPDPDALETMKTDQPTNNAFVRVKTTSDGMKGQE